MASPFQFLVGAALLLSVALLWGGVTVYRRFPSWYPRSETNLGTRGHQFVRVSVTAGGLVGAIGAIIDTLDTVGTLLAVSAENPGNLASLAAAIPPGVGRTMLSLGAAALAAGAVYALAVEGRAAIRD